MNGGVGLTITDIIAFITIAGALAGLWYRIEQSIGKVRDDLAAYKVTVAEDYAKNGYIRDVESRVITQISNVAKEIHGLRESMEEFMRTIMTTNNKRTR